jgi:DNA-directed RNA polymerase specialized sigma24 family protein
MPDSSPSHSTGTARQFVTTQWSAVLAAGDSSAPGCDAALEKLCRAYWYPLYAHIRRAGQSPDDAKDSTQDFLAWILSNKHLRVADPDRGKFRSFLLSRLKHFLWDARKKANAQKRGGGQVVISLDAGTAEERFGLEPATDQTPEKNFDHQWGLSVIEQTVERLRQEYIAVDRKDLFDELKQFQPGDETTHSYSEVAARLGLSESAVKSAIWRLRQRHRELLREEIAQTVATPAEVEEEIRYLISVLNGT